ncbi:hypothetical protein CXB51_000512 [Gossypium anomalum]|uniref:Uncharacterized protein n=1 Tax=Gossypium anomalum TaxID=47600 RepID=A0A8J6D8U6_9ROSI|nr:hypothetical protein CXB51_000512 [Gossypium anomalum]
MTETGKNWHKKLPPTLYAYAGANTFNSSCFKGSNHHPWNGCIGFPEQSDVPSKAAMVSSRQWPLISSYGASGRIQSLKLKMRVSIQSNFDQVTEVCKFLDEKWNPKYCGYCCTKNHHTKFFQQGSPDNVLHGTVIDNKTRLGFRLMICRSLFILYPICIKGAPQPYLLWLLFATLIWQLHSWGQFMKIRDASKTSPSHGGMYAPEVISVPQLSRLKDKVSNFNLAC